MMTLRPGQRIVNIPGIGVQTSRRAVSVAAAAWWLAGGAPTPIAVYQPKGAASLAASYVNLVNPGTYDAALGTEPSFDAATGWTFNGTDQYLATGINPNAQTWSYLIRFSDCAIVDAFQYIFGRTGTGCNVAFGTSESAGNLSYYNGGSLIKSTRLSSGVLAMAGASAYRNGVAEIGTIGAYSGTTANSLWIGAISGGTFGNVPAHKTQAVAIWNTSTNHATWIPAVSAAMAAL